MDPASTSAPTPQTPAPVPVIPAANPVLPPDAFRAAVGDDPFTKIMNATQPAVVIETPKPAISQVASAPAPTPPQTAPHPLLPQTSQPVTPVQPEELVKEALGVTKDSSEENLKALRQAQKKLKEEKEERERELLAAQERLKKFESGEEIPEPIRKREKELEEEVQKLKPYQHLHALKLSEDYEEKFVKPLNDLGDKAVKIATDYEVDPSVITEASKIQNKRDRNLLLKRSGLDEVGVLEMSTLIDQANAIKEAQRNAEANPETTLEELRAQRAEANSKKERERIQSIHSSAKTGMERALQKIKETEYPEFKFTGDPAQDEYAEKILEAATSGYSNVIKTLASNGITNLPEEVTEILAQTFLYGHAGSVAMASRNDHYRRAEEIKANAVRESSMIRPQVGRSSPFSGSALPQPQAPRTPEQTAEALLRSVLPGS